MAGLVERARQANRKIVFPEGSDPRVIAAAERLARERLLEPVLIGPAPTKAPAGVTFIDPGTSDLARKYADVFYERRRAKGITYIEAGQVVRNPLYFASMMVASGDAYGVVGGAATSTAETVRPYLQCIRPAAGFRWVSSFFLMALASREFGHNGLMLFADCAINIDPSAPQLAEIAIATAHSTKTLTGADPAVAMLSFSTKGSARGREAAKIAEAVRVIQARAPKLNVDGEFQLDAAISPAVGRAKAPGSTVAGRANTLIFPDLNSGNIGYKLVQYFGGATAMGPFLQGLAKPANDLSRGCSAEDIYNVAVVTSLQE
jgi:phosphate acetyltransferase